MKGLVFDIKRFAVHDGPGIRTTVFLKGCPLSCWWCHNPESRSDIPQDSVKHIALNGKTFERSETTGREMSVEEILREVEKDRIFYMESGGGFSISGGEPLHQMDFCEELLKKAKEAEIHTTMDTCGYTDGNDIGRIIPYTDLFLYDLKLMDDGEHLKYTGVSNKTILENLRMLVEERKELIIRIPVIPGITDTERNISAVVSFLKELRGYGYSPLLRHAGPRHDTIHPLTNSSSELHLLAYHTVARNKYRRFQMEDKMGDCSEVSPERLSEIGRLFESAGFRVKIGG
jgi:pyruvate formate lyase activating enzyme